MKVMKMMRNLIVMKIKMRMSILKNDSRMLLKDNNSESSTEKSVADNDPQCKNLTKMNQI